MKIKRVFHYVWQVLRILIFVIVAVILIGNIYIAAAKSIFKKSNPTFLGFSSSVVLTGSMSPSIEPDDLVITKKQGSYLEGDIITFLSEGTSVTHRIVSANDDGYSTKGDANNTEDGSPVKIESVTGKVVLIIPKVGRLIGFIRTPIGVLCFLGLTVLIVELPSIAGSIKKRRDESGAQNQDTQNRGEQNPGAQSSNAVHKDTEPDDAEHKDER